MSVELEAGPELDAAVAKACGWKFKIISKRCILSAAKVPASCDPIFAPSTSLDAAFEAAETVSLFKNHLLGRCVAHRRDWRIMERAGERNYIAVGPTAAVAICRAILKLKAANG